jgi:hypothetical protein
MKTFVVWDITLCSPLKINRRFEETYRLNLQGGRINQARRQLEKKKQQADLMLAFYLSYFLPWR